MTNRLHLIFAIAAMLCIAIFFISTIIIEIFGTKELIVSLKRLIVSPGLYILIPSMAIVGASGFSITKKRKGNLITNKQKRMPFIVANGLLILTPCAIFLSQRADASLFDSKFYIVQVLELFSGAINLTLMSMNMRDGLKLTGKLNRILDK